MLSYLRKVMRDANDRGASAVEYGLMVAAIAAVIVGIVFGLGGIMSNIFRSSCASIGSGASQTLPAACQQQGATPPAAPNN